MNPSRSGILYLFIILSIIIGSFASTIMTIIFPYSNMPGLLTLAFGEILIFIPTFVLIMAFGVDIRETFADRKVKLLTMILVVPFTYMLLPLIAACNAFTMLFTDNVVDSVSDEILKIPFVLSFAVIAVFGPFTEELAFRGAEYSGLRKSGNVRRAILLQALMFGLMHLNFNQLVYAFVVGVAIGILREVTGSIWPGFLAHFLINGTSTVAMYFLTDTESGVMSSTAELSKAEILLVMQSYLMMAVFTTSIAILILYLIASIEDGGMERLMRIVRPMKRHLVAVDGSYVEASVGRTVSLPALIGGLVAILIVVVTQIGNY